MIQINLMTDADRKRVQSILDFYHRPFSLRQPGEKKVKCHQCGTKVTINELPNHTHVINYEVDFSSSAFKGKRFHPHYSKRRLMLVDRVKKLMPTLTEILPQKEFQNLLHKVRNTAIEQLTKERKALAKKKRDQQKLSRRINRV